MRAYIIFGLLFSALTGFTQDTALQKQIEQVVDDYCERKGFSGVILVADKGSVVFQQSYGLAYYATPDSIRADYHFAIASITKLFTSIRILQLVEENRINLEERAEIYLPQLESLLSDEVRVSDLLLHTSGLPEEKSRDYRKRRSPTEFAKSVLSRSPSTDRGDFNYNNLDYVILGLMIEEVTGESWEESIENNILNPAGLTSTGFLEYGYYPDRFAYTYRVKREKFKQDPFFYIENFFAAGCMYATAEDLYKFDQALYSDLLLGEEGKELLATSNPELKYVGYGVWNYRYPFIDAQPLVMERRGKILGANVVLVRLTEENKTIVILSNDDRFNPDSFGDPDNLREALIQAMYK
jgi:CubicO group peptidase (beta-lactamase class C family)